MTTTPQIPLPVVHCRGSAAELGQQQGEAFRPKILEFVEQRLAALATYLGERGGGSMSDFLELGERCLGVASVWDPAGTAEHRGIAAGAGVDGARLYAVANMTDLRDVLLWSDARRDEGCSAFALPRALTHTQLLMTGQTWDLNPTDLEYVVAVHRLPTDGLETWSVTCVGCLSLIGMNARGLAVGTTNIKTRRARAGVGYLSLLHRALAAPSCQLAEAAITKAPRAAAHTYWLTDASSSVELECDAASVARRELTEQPLARTNHCLDSGFRAEQGEEPQASSFARLTRLETLLRQGDHSIASLKGVFADREDGVLSINRYPEDEQGTTTNACAILVPERREFWACRGPADRGAWQQLAFETEPT